VGFRRFSSWLRSSRKKERAGVEVAGGVPLERHGVRVFEALPKQAAEEGSQMDLLELSEPRQEVLCVCGCHGQFESHLYSLFYAQFSFYLPLIWVV
jgi:hypothetical protein